MCKLAMIIRKQQQKNTSKYTKISGENRKLKQVLFLFVMFGSFVVLILLYVVYITISAEKYGCFYVWVSVYLSTNLTKKNWQITARKMLHIVWFESK